MSADCFSRKLQMTGLDLQYIRSVWVHWIKRVSLTHLIIVTLSAHAGLRSSLLYIQMLSFHNLA